MWKASVQALILVLAVGLSACVGGGEPPGTRFAAVAPQVPPVAPDRARFFFYRDYALYDSVQRPTITLNGQPAIVSEPGGVSYRDMPPGTYLISVPYSAIYPNKDKIVTVGPGQTVYAKIQTTLYENDTAMADYQPDIFVVVLVDTADGQREIATKRYFP
jgi:hypothetical protein